MTHAKALQRLIQTRTLSTAMLKPLSVTFEQFLRFPSKDHPMYDKVVDVLIAREQGRFKNER